MPTIGLLEGFAPTRMRSRAPIILGNSFDLVPLRRTRLLGFDPAVDRPTTREQGFAVAEYTSKQIAYLLTQINPETGKNYTTREAALAENYARSMRSQAAAMREAERAREKAQYEAVQRGRSQAAAQREAEKLREKTQYLSLHPAPVVKQVLIDDYQGQYPQGDRGGSGGVVSKESFTIPTSSFQPDPAMTIDTRGNSTASFTDAPAGAAAGGGSGLLLPALAAAAYFMLS